MSQCATKHSVLGHIVVESEISPTGVWNSKYCTISCKRDSCSLDYVIRQATKQIDCTAGNDPIKIGHIFYKCPFYGDDTAKCVGSIATKENIGDDVERRMLLKVANNPKNALSEFRREINEEKISIDLTVDDD